MLKYFRGQDGLESNETAVKNLVALSTGMGKKTLYPGQPKVQGGSNNVTKFPKTKRTYGVFLYEKEQVNIVTKVSINVTYSNYIIKRINKHFFFDAVISFCNRYSVYLGVLNSSKLFKLLKNIRNSKDIYAVFSPASSHPKCSFRLTVPGSRFPTVRS